MAIQIRRGTDAQWESNKSNIVVGEPAITTDTERVFVGTGSGTYTELANASTVAEEYNTATSYVVGDIVLYKGQLKRCNTPTSGAWVSANWDDVTLAEAIEAISGAGAIDTDNLVDGAVTTVKIADANVTADKLASNAVTTAKITDGAVAKEKLATAVQEQIDGNTQGISDLNDALDEIGLLYNDSFSHNSSESAYRPELYIPVSLSAGTYCVRLDSLLNINSGVLRLSKAHTLNTSDIVKTLKTDISSSDIGKTIMFSVTEAEASLITYAILFNPETITEASEISFSIYGNTILDLIKDSREIFNVNDANKIIGDVFNLEMERGGFDFSTSAPPSETVYNAKYRARTPIDRPIILPTGTKVYPTSNDVKIAFELYNGNAYSTTGWITFPNSLTIAEDVKSWFMIASSNETGDEIPVETLQNKIGFSFPNSIFDRLEKIENDENILTSKISETEYSHNSSSSDYRPVAWQEVNLSEGNYIIKINSISNITRGIISLLKERTLNTSDTIRKVRGGLNGDSVNDIILFSLTSEEALLLKYIALYDEVETTSQTEFDFSIYKTDLFHYIDLLNGNEAILPSYYYKNNWIQNKIESVNNSMGFINGTSFSFITDIHFTDNDLISKYLLKEVLNKTSCPFVICGGDICPAYGTEETINYSVNMLMEYISAVGKENWFAMVGNHDLNVSDDGTIVSDTWGETYNAIIRNSERNQKAPFTNAGAYCIDNSVQKTRIIVLNSTQPQNNLYSDEMTGGSRITTQQIAWCADRISELNNYKIIIMSHFPSDSEMFAYSSDMQGVQSLLEAVNNKTSWTYDWKTADFTNTTNEIVCHISGHSHKDEYHVSNGVLSISTTCDAHYADDGHGAISGTVTESAFDVFAFDYDTDTIVATRIGRGNNRTWSKNNGVWVSNNLI